MNTKTVVAFLDRMMGKVYEYSSSTSLEQSLRRVVKAALGKTQAHLQSTATTCSWAEGGATAATCSNNLLGS